MIIPEWVRKVQSATKRRRAEKMKDFNGRSPGIPKLRKSSKNNNSMTSFLVFFTLSALFVLQSVSVSEYFQIMIITWVGKNWNKSKGFRTAICYNFCYKWTYHNIRYNIIKSSSSDWIGKSEEVWLINNCWAITFSSTNYSTSKQLLKRGRSGRRRIGN